MGKPSSYDWIVSTSRAHSAIVANPYPWGFSGRLMRCLMGWKNRSSCLSFMNRTNPFLSRLRRQRRTFTIGHRLASFMFWLMSTLTFTRVRAFGKSSQTERLLREPSGRGSAERNTQNPSMDSRTGAAMSSHQTRRGPQTGV